MRVAIHQPGFMPWSGFFRKMALSDTMVMLDDVQYERKGYTNRVKIRTKNGLEWLTVAVKHQPRETLIKDIEISYDNEKLYDVGTKIAENYKYAKNYHLVFPTISDIISSRPKYLWELNMKFITLFKEILKIPADLVMSSDLDIKTKGSDKILDICRLLNADLYVTGKSWAKDNLQIEHFINNDIDVHFLEPVEHKPYKQVYEPFISGASELDYIMNEAQI
jgi:hypothetical protein